MVAVRFVSSYIACLSAKLWMHWSAVDFTADFLTDEAFNSLDLAGSWTVCLCVRERTVEWGRWRENTVCRFQAEISRLFKSRTVWSSVEASPLLWVVRSIIDYHHNLTSQGRPPTEVILETSPCYRLISSHSHTHTSTWTSLLAELVQLNWWWKHRCSLLRSFCVCP